MDSTKTKELLDSFYMARRILDLLPELPEGVLPSYIRYLETILKLQEKQTHVKISELSFALNLPRPGVTRTVNSMEKNGYLRKDVSPEDGRVVYISLTQAGHELFEKFNKIYFEDLSKDLYQITVEDADITMATIQKFYQVMCERRED